MSEAKLLIKNNIDTLSEQLEELLEELHCVYEGEGKAQLSIVKSANELGEDDKKGLVLSPIENVSDFLEKKGRAVVNQEILKNGIGRVLFSRFMGKDSTLNFSKAYGDNVSQANVLKITSHLNIGYYSDIVALDAFKADYNVVAIRNYLQSVITYLAYLHKQKIVDFPIEVDYGNYNNSFIVQIHTSVNSLSLENIAKAFSKVQNANQPFEGLLRLAYRYVDVFDIYQLENASRLVMSGIWFKEMKGKELFPSLFVSSIPSFRDTVDKVLGGDLDVHLEPVDDPSLDEKRLPGQEFSVNYDQISNKALLITKRIVEFVKNKRIGEENPVSLKDFDRNDLEKYLKEYPNKETVSHLAGNDKDLIVKCLKDAALFEGLQKSIDVAKSDTDFDDFASSVVNTISGLKLNEADEIMRVAGRIDEDQESSMVKGWLEDEIEKARIEGVTEDISEENTLVKGSKEDLTEDITRIKGHGEGNILSEKWNAKKSEIIENLKEQITIIKGNGGDLAALQNEIVKTISNTLGIDEEQSMTLAGGLLENATAPFVTEDLGKNSSEVERNLENEKMKRELHNKNTQIEKMRKVMERMRDQLQKRLEKEEQERIAKNLGEESEEGVNKFRNKLSEGDAEEEKVEEKKHEVAIAKLRESSQKIIEHKDKEIQELIKKIEDLQNNSLQSSDDKLKTIELQKECENLKTQLEMANKRLSTMSENLDEQKRETSERESENKNSLIEQTKIAQQALYKFKEEKAYFEKKVTDQEKEIKALKETLDSNKAGNTDEDEIKSDQQIKQLNEEAKLAEEKQRELNLKNKQLEQKIKFLTAQLEEAGKKAKHANGGKQDAQTAHKLKQLERLNSKLEERKKKMTIDLNIKKKEAVDLRSENTTLKNQIQDLERKLLKYEKKAS